METPEEKAKATDHPEYSSIHVWLSKNFGKADKCESVNCKGDSRKYEWAKIANKEYEKNRGNFMKLCISCHRRYDTTDKMRANMSKLMKGRTPHNKGNDLRVTRHCIHCSLPYFTYKRTQEFCSRSCASSNREEIKRQNNE